MEGTRIRILLVEDSDLDAALVESLLHKGVATFQPERVRRVSEVAAALDRGPFQAVLLDLGLPDAEGLDSYVQVSQAAPSLPIVILTGNEDDAVAMQAVKAGAQDYLFKGDLRADSLDRALRYAIERQRISGKLLDTIAKLESALAEISTLQGLLPICAECKKIRDDGGYWQQVEAYIADRSNAQFSHSICPNCFKKHYPEYYYSPRR